jgi:predicted nucleic acid-binding Zn ribbon protein
LTDDAHTLAADFVVRRDREERRFHAREPKAIGKVLAQLITAKGYGRIQASADFSAAWQAAVGDALAKYSLPGRIRRSVLDVTVANSMVVQELTFQKHDILKRLQAEFPDAKLRDLKFRVGKIS